MMLNKVTCKAPRLSAAPAAPRRVASRVSAHKQQPQKPQQQEPEQDSQNFAALPLAGLLAAALMAAPLVMPADAFAARSSGRAGGSSGFSARKMAPSAPRMSTRTEAAPQMRSSTTNIMVAPAPYAVSPFGFSPFGFSPFGGFGYGGGIGIGFPVFGGLFQFLALALTVSVVFNVIKSFASSGSGNKDNKKDGDGWGDL